MKRFLFAVMAVLISAGASFFLQGCTVRFVVNPQATPVPYPNAWHIELRVRAQINRVSAGLQQGNLSQDTANVLAENDALVRRMVREYQGPPATRVDLNGNQTVFLDNMLNDNDRYIDDAFQRNQAWVSSFQNRSFDYASSDKTLFIASLDYQLNRQQADVDSGLSSGNLTNAQAGELRSRIRVIRELRYNDYRSNGRIDLSEEQVRQLSQMTEDNARYLRYRINGSHGRWNKEQFNRWRSNVPAGLDNGGHSQWGRDPHVNGFHSQDSAVQNGVNPHTLNATTNSTGQNTVNPHNLNSSTNSTSLPHTDSGQNAQSPHLIPTPTMTMVVRKPDQPPTNTPTPVPAIPTNTLAPKLQAPTPVPAMPTNTSVPKLVAPVPTNIPVIIRNPVLTPMPQRERPKATPTKAPVKVKPTPTKSPKKDDQVEGEDAHHLKEKGDEKANPEGKKGSDEGDQGSVDKKKPDTDSSKGDHSDSNSQDDNGSGQGKKPGGPHGD